ncbi:hypothetical protein BRADI_1g46735v3 [Brachypodium distachyon]|uniref:Uncharacterized protein n=1 Tax=Brachypodium distachyon TaxID=15368 RepID=A0A2K2DPS9_BRADI|nr:hypothetical protein BRADI_1g46735v3 [Brachypodium distachyon]
MHPIYCRPRVWHFPMTSSHKQPVYHTNVCISNSNLIHVYFPIPILNFLCAKRISNNTSQPLLCMYASANR